MDQQAEEEPPVVVLAQLGSLVRRAFATRMADEAWAADAGMRPGCFSVLRTVAGAGEPPSQRLLSDRLGIDPSDMVGLIDVLEQAGYLSRQRDPADRRRHALVVTPAGRRALARFEQVASLVADDVLGVLDDPDRAALEALLGRVVAAHEGAAVGLRA